MDLESLQATAVSTVEENVRKFEEQQRINAQRAEVVAELCVAMEARLEAYTGLASVALQHHTGREGFSAPISVGRVMVRAHSGNDVERTLRVVVSNDYGKDMYDHDIQASQLGEGARILPKAVTVSYFIEANEGDNASGLLTHVHPLGDLPTGGSKRRIKGQRLSTERYERHTAPVSEDLYTATNTRGRVNLYSAEKLDRDSASTQLLIVNAETPQMLETLSLLQAGIQQAQAVV